MSLSSAVSVVQRASPSRRRLFTRSALAVGTLGMLLAPPRTADAQTSSEQEARTAPRQRSGWELRIPSGGLVPAGAQRGVLKDAHLSAVQLSYAFRPSLAVTGTAGWARSRDLVSANDPKLDVFTYDLGVEARGPELFTGRAVAFSPFAGAGAGARSYNHRNVDIDATHNVAAYGTVGGELGMGRFGVRLEVRDYVTGFKPLSGEGTARARRRGPDGWRAVQQARRAAGLGNRARPCPR
jgi:hypothetical protein